MTDQPPQLPDDELGERLAGQRPVPRPEFRGALRRRLVVRDPGYGPRPAALRSTVAAYLLGGLLVMFVGALQAAGVL